MRVEQSPDEFWADEIVIARTLDTVVEGPTPARYNGHIGGSGTTYAETIVHYENRSGRRATWLPNPLPMSYSTFCPYSSQTGRPSTPGRRSHIGE